MSRSDIAAVRPPVEIVKSISAGQSVNVRRNYATRKDARVAIESFPQQGSLQNMFLGQYCEVLMRGSALSAIRKNFLNISIVNNGTTTATLVQAPLLLQYYQIYVGQSQLISTTYAENLAFQTWSSADSNETGVLASQQNWTYNPSGVSYSSTGSTGQVGGTGGTQNLYIEIPTVMSALGEGMPPCLTGDISIRFYFTNNPFATNSAMTTVANLQIQSLQLFSIGERLGPVAMASLRDTFKGPVASSCYVPERQIINLGSSSITANTTIQQVITNFAGSFAFLCAFLRRSSATQERILGFDYAAGGVPSDYVCSSPNFGGGIGVQFLDSTNTVLNVTGLDYKLITLGQSLGFFDTPFFSTFTNMNLLLASDDPVGSMGSGLRSGDFYLDNSYSIQLSPYNTLSNGADLVLLGWRLLAVTINPGGQIIFRTM